MYKELRAMLMAHAERYPVMEPQDAVKLIYQNEFGGGHMVADPARSLDRLRVEYAHVSHDPSIPFAEDVGNGLVRINLDGLDPEEYPLEALNRDFVRSAELCRGSLDVFLQKVDFLRSMAEEGVLPFSAQELDDYLKLYIAVGGPPLSHSKRYRETYYPSYRVLLREVCLPLMVREVQERSKTQGRVIAALDGRCAAGKTTLAARLEERYGWSVVHMDHFFLRPVQKSRSRYARPGENVDHERFLEEVLLPLRKGERPVYRPYDCHTQTLADPIPFEPGPVVLVEGSYACHPELWKYYDVRVFLTVDRSVQMERIVAREDEDSAQMYREKWIPMEERYFSAYRVEQQCDYRLEG